MPPKGALCHPRVPPVLSPCHPCSYQLGSGEASIVSEDPINDGEWHRVTVTRWVGARVGVRVGVRVRVLIGAVQGGPARAAAGGWGRAGERGVTRSQRYGQHPGQHLRG